MSLEPAAAAAAMRELDEFTRNRLIALGVFHGEVVDARPRLRRRSTPASEPSYAPDPA